MFSRIHSLKFQNKLAKDTMKNSLKSIIDTFFSDGLLFSTFIEIDDVTLNYVNVWDSKLSNDAITKKYLSFYEQVKEMGIKFSVIGGETEVRYSDPKIFNHFTKVWSFYVSPCHLLIADQFCYSYS